MLIDLILIGGAQNDQPVWPLGQVWPVAPFPAAIDRLIQERLLEAKADCWLFYDVALGLPDPQLIESISRSPGDVWHAGLKLGMNGLPGLMDYVAPTWMLARDPDSEIEATSWRVSLRACLVRTAVFRQLGGVRPEFTTLAGAALEFGYRAAKRGALTRHVPSLVPAKPEIKQPEMTFADELRLVYYGHGKRWAQWAVMRAALTGYTAINEALRTAHKMLRQPLPPSPASYRHQKAAVGEDAIHAARVTVLIPTIDRYPYLRPLLDQLRRQTINPHEIIIIDQTARARRDETIAIEFSDLPLNVLYQDNPGQCSSRNVGLQVATSDYILFLDDDDEVKPDLIERHLKTLQEYRADVSSGVVEEQGSGPLPDDFKFTRISDVFPTGNTLIRREVLGGSGLFDLAYNRGSRADGDLGMRVYLSGALMILNPEITLLHHRAPMGGLRTYKARMVTNASSRQSLTQRHLPAVTELYLKRRYFSEKQQREARTISVLGSFSMRGNLVRKVMKAFISAVCLPHTLWVIRKRSATASEMCRDFPKIPQLAFSEKAGSASDSLLIISDTESPIVIPVGKR